MKNIKSEKGAITILVLVSILFMVSFLISSYVIIANKVQAQKEIIEQTKSIYGNYNMEEIYDSYFGKNIIPISNKDQLLAIGTGVDKIINGSYYNFANNDKTIYILTSDITINAYEEEVLKNEEGKYYWTPIGERTDLLSGFEGNNHEIIVNYKDNEDNTDYSVTYSKENNYVEPEYSIKVIPITVSEKGVENKINDAKILTSDTNNEEELKEVGTGEITVTVKRLVPIWVQARSDKYKSSGVERIYIENPNKIRDYNLVLGKYTFTINPIPNTANVKINGENRTTISVEKGEKVSWEVSANEYTTQTGIETIIGDKTLEVILRGRFTFTVNPTPADSTVAIYYNGTLLKNGTGAQSVMVDSGTKIDYTVNRAYYKTQSNSITMNSSITKQVTLEKKDEQTMTLRPSSVSGSSYTSLNSANNTNSNTGSFAYTSSTNELTWNFNATNLNPNAEIKGIDVKYRLGTTVANTKAVINFKANGTSYFTKTTVGLNLLLEGKEYTDTISNIPSVTNIRNGLTLSAKKSSSGLAFLRCYGATIIIKYIDP